MTVSRRDFLRLRTGEHGRVLEVSCRMLYMRCHDATIATPSAEDYDQAVGEPPAVIARRTPEDIFDALDRDLQDVQVLRLIEPGWLDGIDGGAKLQSIVDRFRKRGGRVEGEEGSRK